VGTKLKVFLDGGIFFNFLAVSGKNCSIAQVLQYNLRKKIDFLFWKKGCLEERIDKNM